MRKKKNKALTIVALCLSLATLIACDGKSQRPSAPAAPAAPPKDSLLFQPGYEYVFYPDGSCRPEDQRVCLDPESYVTICQKKPDLSMAALRGLGYSNTDFGILAESGYNNLTYQIEPQNERPCEIRVTVSGLIRGTSRNITVTAAPYIFFAKDDGNLLLKHAKYLYQN